MKEGKSFEISKHAVLEAYKRVKANRGAPGVDGMDFEKFEANLKNNLYKLWNRMSSGSYFPQAVRGVEIPKKDGRMRLLGIPTIMDRVAQMVVRMHFEPLVEPLFYEDSYGYRPGKSAADAVGVVRERCWEKFWVLEIDIKGLFDNIDHELMMKAVNTHTDSKWMILYIERFLKAPMRMPDGTARERNAGTPQGGVISPVLANLFMHYAFDHWMTKHHPRNPWARYADDAVIHCTTKQEAERLLESLKRRMAECKLELHPEKTRIVFCGRGRKPADAEHVSFDFLGYTFRKRTAQDKKGKLFTTFSPAVSAGAAQQLRDKIKDIRMQSTMVSFETLARRMNPVMQGWANYFSRFRPSEAKKVLNYVNLVLFRWVRRQFKSVKGSRRRALQLVARVAQTRPDLFYHWTIGLRPTIG